MEVEHKDQYYPRGYIDDIVNHKRVTKGTTNTVPSWLENYPKNLNDINLKNENISFSKFDPKVLITDKSNIKVNDNLFNEKNFCRYWKKRSKQANKEFNIGKQDIDGDNVKDYIAYLNENGKHIIYGFNNYNNTGPQSSQDYWKRAYYSQGVKKREQQSYADYFREHFKDQGTEEWLDAERRKKIQKAIDGSMVEFVKKHFADCENFQALTPAQKNKIAKLFIKTAFEGMISDDVPGPQKKFIKQHPRVIEARDNCLVEIFKNSKIPLEHKKAIVAKLARGDNSVVENYIYDLVPDYYFITKEDAKYLFDVGTEKRLARKNKRRAKKNKTGIAPDVYLKRYYYPTDDLDWNDEWKIPENMSEESVTEEEQN